MIRDISEGTNSSTDDNPPQANSDAEVIEIPRDESEDEEEFQDPPQNFHLEPSEEEDRFLGARREIGATNPITAHSRTPGAHSFNGLERQNANTNMYRDSAIGLGFGSLFWFFGATWLLIALVSSVAFASSRFIARRLDGVHHSSSEIHIGEVDVETDPQTRSKTLAALRALGLGASIVVSGGVAFIMTEGGLIMFALSAFGLGGIVNEAVNRYGLNFVLKINNNGIGRKIIEKLRGLGVRVNSFKPNEYLVRVVQETPPLYLPPTRPAEAVLRGELSRKGIKVFAFLLGVITISAIAPVSGMLWASIYGVGVFGPTVAILTAFSKKRREIQANRFLEDSIIEVLNISPSQLRMIDGYPAIYTLVSRFSSQYPRLVNEILDRYQIVRGEEESAEAYSFRVAAALINHYSSGNVIDPRLRNTIIEILSEDPAFEAELISRASYDIGGFLASLARLANLSRPIIDFVIRLPLLALLRILPDKAKNVLEGTLAVGAVESADAIRTTVLAIRNGVTPENVQNYNFDNSLFYPLVRVVVYGVINLSIIVAIPWATLTAIFGSMEAINVGFAVGGVIWGLVSSVLIYLNLETVDNIVLSVLPDSIGNRHSVMIFFGRSEGHTDQELRTARTYRDRQEELARAFDAMFENAVPAEIRAARTRRSTLANLEQPPANNDAIVNMHSLQTSVTPTNNGSRASHQESWSTYIKRVWNRVADRVRILPRIDIAADEEREPLIPREALSRQASERPNSTTPVGILRDSSVHRENTHTTPDYSVLSRTPRQGLSPYLRTGVTFDLGDNTTSTSESYISTPISVMNISTIYGESVPHADEESFMLLSGPRRNASLSNVPRPRGVSELMDRVPATITEVSEESSVSQDEPSAANANSSTSHDHQPSSDSQNDDIGYETNSINARANNNSNAFILDNITTIDLISFESKTPQYIMWDGKKEELSNETLLSTDSEEYSDINLPDLKGIGPQTLEELGIEESYIPNSISSTVYVALLGSLMLF